MSKVTSKLQIKLPKALMDRLGVKPGDEIQLEVAGELMCVIPAAKNKRRTNQDRRSLQLRYFDLATRRQKQRETSHDPELLRSAKAGRGWIREQLYTRGSTE